MLKLLRITQSTLCRGLRAVHFLSGAPIDVSPEIQHALRGTSIGPVVALETALVTHGLPQPINLETALSVESKVRSVGAIPATIGLLDGRIKVGLSRTQLERLADVKVNPGFVKLSRRDLAAAIGLRLSGGTTVSGTSVIANLVGIPIFATGGLGGVHRGGEISWDVSADLTELGRTAIAVVSAGVKSILDIPRTLEYLETQGVGVFTYGSTNDFPGFFGPVTGYKSPWRVDSPEIAARLILAGKTLDLHSGMLFAAPIPEESTEMASFIQNAVNRAVKESEENGVSGRGKEVTPWLLARVAELTQGKSIVSNVALLENTATIGGQIAVEYAKLSSKEYISEDTVQLIKAPTWKEIVEEKSITAKTHDALPPASVIVIGAAAIDITSQPDRSLPGSATLIYQSTVPGQVSFSSGGVARNIAEAVHRILSTSTVNERFSVLLISSLANDLFGSLVEENMRKVGMRTDGFLRNPGAGERSAVCNMHLDPTGNLIGGVAEMSTIHNMGAQPVIEVLEKHRPLIVAFDANLNPDTLASLLCFCNQRHISTFFEPTSATKSSAVLPALRQMIDSAHFHSAPVTFASPNLLELSQIYQEIMSSPDELTSMPHWWSVVDGLGLGEDYRHDLAQLSRQQISPSATGGTLAFLADGTAQMAVSLLPFFQHLFVKCGEKGVFVAMRVVGEAALSSVWSRERTRLEKHQIIAKGKDSILVLRHYPAIRIDPEKVVNVTGAGDSFVGTLLAGITQHRTLGSPEIMDKLIDRAQRASKLSLYSTDAVGSLLTDSSIDAVQ